MALWVISDRLAISAMPPTATKPLHYAYRREGQEQTSFIAGQGSDFIKHVRA
jgi:hypothetical protein